MANRFSMRIACGSVARELAADRGFRVFWHRRFRGRRAPIQRCPVEVAARPCSEPVCSKQGLWVADGVRTVDDALLVAREVAGMSDSLRSQASSLRRNLSGKPGGGGGPVEAFMQQVSEIAPAGATRSNCWYRKRRAERRWLRLLRSCRQGSRRRPSLRPRMLFCVRAVTSLTIMAPTPRVGSAPATQHRERIRPNTASSPHSNCGLPCNPAGAGLASWPSVTRRLLRYGFCQCPSNAIGAGNWRTSQAGGGQAEIVRLNDHHGYLNETGLDLAVQDRIAVGISIRAQRSIAGNISTGQRTVRYPSRSCARSSNRPTKLP